MFHTQTFPGIHDLQQLTTSAPSDNKRREQLNHLFMGYPRSHCAFPVALYDPILALLAYKLERLDVDEAKAEKLFPDAETFRSASDTFLSECAYDYNTEKGRSAATFRWLKEIFPDCVEQFRVKEATTRKSKAASKPGTTKSTPSAGSEQTSNSRGSRASAIPDAVVYSQVKPPTEESPTVDITDVPAPAAVLKTLDEQTVVFRVIVEIKKRFGEAVLQCAKGFGRHILTLEVRWIRFLRRCFMSDSFLTPRTTQSSTTRTSQWW